MWYSNLKWFYDLSVDQQLFVTKFKDGWLFREEFNRICNECKWFNVEIPLNNKGRINMKDAVELMMFWDEYSKEC